MSGNRKVQVAIAGLSALYALTAIALAFAVPQPHREFEYMVIGTGATAATMLAFFLGRSLRRRS